ncbi:hypothetical protein [Calidithermus terrae]|uniref:hypothetical protein n=1 Tax=Calidithermus terrae TaxID=1408545 RepID=UPI0011C4240B|nr:hypothetical protein [Calidithermus terrae]
MFNHHFVAANFIRQAMRDALEGSGPTERPSLDTQEILLAANTPRPAGWLEPVLRWWRARYSAVKTEAKC